MKSLLSSFSRIYIIGKLSPAITIQQRRKYHEAQTLLQRRGFEVVNPVALMEGENIGMEDVWRKGLQELLSCGSVYILNDVSFRKGENLELKIAMDLNLVFFQQPERSLETFQDDFGHEADQLPFTG